MKEEKSKQVVILSEGELWMMREKGYSSFDFLDRKIV